MTTTAPRGRISRATAARAVARKLALQALYSWQVNPRPWQDLLAEFLATDDGPKSDREYLQQLLQSVCTDIQTLDVLLEGWTDRPAVQLDPIEHAALLIGVQELRAQPEVPYRVAISEAVSLARRFGATDGHKFVNAVLDVAARSLRPHET
jgi:N utilization substance protein B